LTKLPSTPKQPSTPLATPDRRAGTYDRDDDVIGLLRYGTLSVVDIPRDRQRTTGGSAADRDLVLDGDCISARHFVMERRASGLYVTDDASTNGLAYDTRRHFGLALKSSFEDKRDEGEGFVLTPGMTFVVGAEPYRFIALDDTMREQYPKLVEILGPEDEIRSSATGTEPTSPSDLILAADSPGHLLITGRPGCDQEDLARIIHKMSKRRRQAPVEIDEVPDDRRGQNALLKTRGTLVLNLGVHSRRLDPAFVSSLFSPSYHIRVIAIARTANQARRSLGHEHWCRLMHIALRPMELRRAEIPNLLDQFLTARGSVLRMADMTSHNQRALLFNPWRENLRSLRETAVRLDAMVLAGFSRKGAAAALGLKRQTFDHWFNNTMRLSKPLVSDVRKRSLIAALAARPPAPT
jgi:hypothetical protein